METVKVKTAEGMMLYKKDDPATFYMKNYKIWDAAVCVALERFLKTSDTFIDIGAHVGYLSRLASDLVGPTGIVYAFEPAKDNYDLLAENLKSKKNCFFFKNVISDKTSESKIFTTKKDSTDVRLFDFPGADNYELVSGVKLDDFLFEEVNLIKIDAQGSEDLVIRGAIETINTWKPYIIVSFDKNKIENTGSTAGAILDFYDSIGYSWSFLDYSNESGHLLLIPEHKGDNL